MSKNPKGYIESCWNEVEINQNRFQSLKKAERMYNEGRLQNEPAISEPNAPSEHNKV